VVLGGGATAQLGEVAVDDRVGGEPGGLHRLLPARQAVDAGSHVRRPGDGPDPAAPDLDEVARGIAAARDVVDVDVRHARRLVERPAAEHARQPDPRHGRGEPVVAVV
jgi:hypothetical protein